MKPKKVKGVKEEPELFNEPEHDHVPGIRKMKEMGLKELSIKLRNEVLKQKQNDSRSI